MIIMWCGGALLYWNVDTTDNKNKQYNTKGFLMNPFILTQENKAQCGVSFKDDKIYNHRVHFYFTVLTNRTHL